MKQLIEIPDKDPAGFKMVGRVKGYGPLPAISISLGGQEYSHLLYYLWMKSGGVATYYTLRINNSTGTNLYYRRGAYTNGSTFTYVGTYNTGGYTVGQVGTGAAEQSSSMGYIGAKSGGNRHIFGEWTFVHSGTLAHERAAYVWTNTSDVISSINLVPGVVTTAGYDFMVLGRV